MFSDSVLNDGVLNDSVLNDGVLNDNVLNDGVFNAGKSLKRARLFMSITHDSENIICKKYVLHSDEVNKNTGIYTCPCARHQSCWKFCAALMAQECLPEHPNKNDN